MQTTKITKFPNSFKHESETVTTVINHLINYYKPTDKETLIITEILSLSDYGNQYVFLIHFLHLTENEDIQEEIETLIPDIESFTKSLPSDFLITMQCDYSHNDHFTLLTFTK